MSSYVLIELSPWMVLTNVEPLPDEIRKRSSVICHGLCTLAECTFQVVFWWLHRMCSKGSYMKYWLSEVQRHRSPLRRATFPLHSTVGEKYISSWILMPDLFLQCLPLGLTLIGFSWIYVCTLTTLIFILQPFMMNTFPNQNSCSWISK